MNQGLSLELLDRSGGQLSLEQFGQVAQTFIQTAKATDRFERVSTRFDASFPRWRLELDRDQLAALDLDYGATLREIGTAFGGRYIDDTYDNGPHPLHCSSAGWPRATSAGGPHGSYGAQPQR